MNTKIQQLYIFLIFVTIFTHTQARVNRRSHAGISTEQQAGLPPKNNQTFSPGQETDSPSYPQKTSHSSDKVTVTYMNDHKNQELIKPDHEHIIDSVPSKKPINPLALPMLNADTQSSFRQTIRFGRTNIKRFFEDVYNHNQYAQGYLAFNFGHVVEFLSHTHKCAHPHRYIRSCCKLFNQKIKGAHFINPYAASDLFDTLPKQLGHYCKNAHEAQKENIRTLVYNFFESDFEDLHTDTQGTIDRFVDTLYQAMHTTPRGDCTIDQVQQALFQFLENICNKIIWPSQTGTQSWDIFVFLGKQLETMKLHELITDEQTNELYWSLISRFCYYLRLTGTQLPITFFDTAYTHLMHENIDLFCHEEQEALIMPKRDFLARAIIQAKASAQAETLQLGHAQ